jgi:hypothetical protein
MFTTTLAKHRRDDYIAQANALRIAPALNEPVFEPLYVGLLISVFPPVLDMSFPKVNLNQMTNKTG